LLPRQRVPRLPIPGTGTGGGQTGGVGGGFDPGSIPFLQSGGGGSGGGAAAGASADAPASAPDLAAATAPASDPVQPAPASIAETPARDVLDIELLDVRLVDGGSLERNMGPRYRLFYRNNGNVEAPKFHASVAVDIGEKLTETAEIVTVEAVGIKPGKLQTVDVRLPVEVLKMAIDYEGQPAAFSILVAMIDSDEILNETDEVNNILVFARDEIKSVVR
jgi:hypothetical protein